MGNVVTSIQSGKQRPSKIQTTRTTMSISSLKQETLMSTTKSQVANVASSIPTAPVRHELGKGTSRAITHPDNDLVAHGRAQKPVADSSMSRGRVIIGLCLSTVTLIHPCHCCQEKQNCTLLEMGEMSSPGVGLTMLTSANTPSVPC